MPMQAPDLSIARPEVLLQKLLVTCNIAAKQTGLRADDTKAEHMSIRFAESTEADACWCMCVLEMFFMTARTR
jgi:hypothetical protein